MFVPPFNMIKKIQQRSRINKNVSKSVEQLSPPPLPAKKVNQSKVRAICSLWLQCVYPWFYISSKVSVNPQLNYPRRVHELICTFYILITMNKQNQLLKQI